MPQFDSSTFISQVFWLIVCFGTLVASFVFVFVPRINSILESRAEKMRADKEQLLQIKEQIHHLLQMKEEKISHAEKEAEALIEATLKEMEEKKQKQYQAIDIETSKSIRDLQESLEKQKQGIYKDLAPFIEECVKKALPKIMGINPDLPHKDQGRKINAS